MQKVNFFTVKRMRWAHTIDRSTFAFATALAFSFFTCWAASGSPNSTVKEEMNQEDTAQCHKGIVLSLLSDPHRFHLKLPSSQLCHAKKKQFCNVFSFGQSIATKVVQLICSALNFLCVEECWIVPPTINSRHPCVFICNIYQLLTVIVIIHPI